jgi:hypothetical protein
MEFDNVARLAQPGAILKPIPAVFIVGSDGCLYERVWDGRWMWGHHSRPMLTSSLLTPQQFFLRDSSLRLEPIRPTYVSEDLVVVVLKSGQLASRTFRGPEWDWEVRLLACLVASS